MREFAVHSGLEEALWLHSLSIVKRSTGLPQPRWRSDHDAKQSMEASWSPKSSCARSHSAINLDRPPLGLQVSRRVQFDSAAMHCSFHIIITLCKFRPFVGNSPLRLSCSHPWTKAQA
jgi:hypothetical protein